MRFQPYTSSPHPGHTLRADKRTKRTWRPRAVLGTPRRPGKVFNGRNGRTAVERAA
jgi:hypothetical protein